MISVFKRILSILIGLCLMAFFYVFLVMQHDETKDRSREWVVENPSEAALKPQGSVSGGSALLAKAMGCAVPLPIDAKGQVVDADYHGYYARLLSAQSGKLKVTGVRPASAAPLAVPQLDLAFTASDKTLAGYPLLIAENKESRYFALVTPQAAFYFSIPLGTSLQTGIQMIGPAEQGEPKK